MTVYDITILENCLELVGNSTALPFFPFFLTSLIFIHFHSFLSSTMLGRNDNSGGTCLFLTIMVILPMFYYQVLCCGGFIDIFYQGKNKVSIFKIFYEPIKITIVVIFCFLRNICVCFLLELLQFNILDSYLFSILS